MIDKFFLPQQPPAQDDKENQEKEIKYTTEHIQILNNHEFRIQLEFQSNIRVKLISGTAFIMGMELSPFYHYTFPNNVKSSFIYSFQGCTIILIYPEDVKISHYCHEDENRKNIKILNLGELLECNRQESLSRLCFGPRVMLLGGACSGKSTVLSILGNQAITRNWNPLVLNLDPCGGSSDIPGVISLKSFSDFWYQMKPNSERLSFFFGSDELDKRKDLYIKSVEAMMTSVETLLDSNLDQFKEDLESLAFLDKKLPIKSAFSSGVFIDTPTGIENFDKKNLKKFIDLVNPDYIICIHCDRLKGNIESIYNKEKTIILLEMNGGVKILNSMEKSSLINIKLQNFFYSNLALFLRDKVNFGQVSIYKLDSIESLPLNYVSNQIKSKLKLAKIDPRITDLKGKYD